MRQLLFFGIWFYVFMAELPAQGWQRNFGNPWDDRTFALQLLPDGSLVAAGSSIPDSGALTDWYFLQTDAFGALQTEQRWGDAAWNEGANVLLKRPAGGWLLAGTRYVPQSIIFLPPTLSNIHLALTDDNGVMSQESILPGDYTYLKNACPFNNGYLLIGAQYVPGLIDSYSPKPFYAKVDQDGQMEWAGRFDGADYGEASDALFAANGEGLIGGWVQDSTDQNVLVIKVSEQGQGMDTLLLRVPGYQYADKITATPDGNFLLTGRTNLGPNSGDLWLVALTQQLDTLWTRAIGIPGIQQAHAALALPDGRILFAGETQVSQTASRDAFLACTDAEGKLLWYKTYGGLKGDIFWDIKQAADGGFALAGQTASFGDGSLQAWLVRTDSLGNVWSNTAAGRVVREAAMNCLADPNEQGLPGWLVTASGTQGTVYSRTDTLGNYAMTLDTGAWYVSVLPPAGYWTPCEDSIPLVFDQFYQNSTLDFPVQTAYNCPFLYVDITAGYLRRCYENPYFVHYFNYGPATASNATVRIIPDPYLQVTGASLPYTSSGDSLLFQIGDVPSLTGGDFNLITLLGCDSTVLGQVHCTSAHCTPDSLCTVLNPIWDGSNLVVNGYCAGDSVMLTIANTGAGNMGGPVDFVITEDQIIFKRAPIQLAAGQDTTFVLYPNGATVAIMTSQTPGNPVSNTPTLVIEGCGGFPFSTGYALQFPNDDGDPFTDIDCRENTGAFDPNDKTGLPHGVGDQHLIAPGTAIDYLIRFQNTGTDTAFRVEIRDTLPAGLDLTSFERGASSHPYRLEVLGSGVLRFLFDPIQLPDSSANYAGSQGFVKFRISTRRGLPAGATIQNRAAIYFDFNLPVLTGYTHHRIGNPLNGLLVGAGEAKDKEAGPQLFVTPNPFRDFTTLRWPATRPGLPYQVEISDASGRLWLSGTAADPKYELIADCLPAGLYVVRVSQNGQNLVTGKLITHKP